MGNIYIHIEVKKREFDAKLLLAMAAAERGHRVLLGHVKPLLDADALTPGIILDKSLTPRPKKIAQLERARAAGHAFTSIDEESGILGADFQRFAALRYSRETLALANAVFFWGDFDHGAIAKDHPELTSRFHKTGNARVDLWRPQMASCFDEPVDVPQPFVLLASNLGTLVGRRSFEQELAQLRASASRGLEEEDEAWFYARWAHATQLAWDFIHALRLLSKAHPKLNLVLRPHPTESAAVWQAAIGHRPNIFVRDQGAISPWLRKASGLIHNGCTTAIEAAISGIPVLSYQARQSELDFEYPNRLGRTACTAEALSELVGSLHGVERDEQRRNHAVLSERLAALEGALASDKIADVWDGLSSARQSSRFWKKPLIATPATAVQLVDAYRLASLPILRGLKLGGTVGWKFPAFSKAEIESRMQKFSAALNRFARVKARIAGPRLCALELEHG